MSEDIEGCIHTLFTNLVVCDRHPVVGCRSTRLQTYVFGQVGRNGFLDALGVLSPSIFATKTVAIFISPCDRAGLHTPVAVADKLHTKVGRHPRWLFGAAVKEQRRNNVCIILRGARLHTRLVILP